MGRQVNRIVVKTRKVVRVRCPYCRNGRGNFKYVMTNFGEIEGDAGDPIRCEVCEKYFIAKPKIFFEGVPMEMKTPTNGMVFGGESSG